MDHWWLRSIQVWMKGNDEVSPTDAPNAMTHRGAVFLLDGNIAVGKSTLCSALASPTTSRDTCDNTQPGLPPVVPVHEDVGTAFTRLFYQNQARYGFALQMTLHAQRAAAVTLAVHRASTQTTVLDRSIIGDWAFALWNAALGNLTLPEWTVYLERAGSSPVTALLQTVGSANTDCCVVVFLYDDAQSCRVRVVRRDDVDADVDETYLQGIEATHLLVMASLPACIPVVELAWAEYASDNGTRRLREAMQRRRPDKMKRPTVSVDDMAKRRSTLVQRANHAISQIQQEQARHFLEKEAVRLLANGQ